MTDNFEEHPAEVLANHLNRASSLAATLGALYTPNSESFAAGNSFIAHAILAVTTLISDAQVALDNLNKVCDLRPLSASVHGFSEDPAQDELMVFRPEPATELNHDDSVDAPVDIEPVQSSQHVLQDDQFAQSYLELLRKLTAAEVFAAEQQALAPPGTTQNLLPLLRSLREEFQKLHRAA